MLRVLGTLKCSAFSQNFESQIEDLGSWVSEIHSGMYPYLVRIVSPLLSCLCFLKVALATQRSVQKLCGRLCVQRYQQQQQHRQFR